MGETALCQAWACESGTCKKVDAEKDTACSAKKTDNPCTAFACNAGKCEEGNIGEGQPCDDGNPCQGGTVCTSGKCSGGKKICDPCKGDNDCPDDGNPCNGDLYCNSGTCKTNPSSVVTCATGKDTDCIKNQCDPDTGACALKAMKSDTLCEDGDKCTANDACNGQGKCVPGDPTKACVCTKDADCAKHEDGDVCNGTLYCDKKTGGCQLNQGTIVTCPSADDTACVKNTCNKKTGKCAPQATGAKVCDDSDPCTLSDACTQVDGKPVCAGKPVCDCQKDADCANQEDGDLCNGTLFCDTQVGKCKTNPKTKIHCPSVDDTQCLKNTCQPKTGKCAMTPVPEATTCDDGKDCTVGEECDKTGACVADKKSNVCWCEKDDDCLKTDDGDLCNGTPYCDKSDPKNPKCTDNPVTVVSCKTVDNGPCNKSVCDPKTGKCAMTTFAPGTTCDDGQPCTQWDSCDSKGVCVGSDACECLKDADCNVGGKSNKDDGDLCNGVYYCDKSGKGAGGTCQPKPGSAVICGKADNTDCTKNQCQPKTGKCALTVVNAQIGKPCDDGNICTLNTKCQGGVCTAGAPKDCDDKNPCTTDACEPKSDCVHKASGAKFCDDGDACTAGDTCVGKVCKAGAPKKCDEGKPCLSYACDKKTGCVATATDGKPCDDGDKCTIKDSCKGATCAPGAKQPCSDGNACTDDACDPKTGCVFTNNTAPCKASGSVCSVNDACAGGVCKKGPDKLWQWGAGSVKNRPETKGVEATLAFEPKSGALFAAMNVKTPGGKFNDVALVRFNADGTEAKYSPLAVQGSPQLGEMVASGGALVMCGQRAASDGGDGALIRVLTDGSLAFDKDYDPGGADGLKGCAPSVDGGAWAVGAANNKGNDSSEGWLLRVSATGKQSAQALWKQTAWIDLWAVSPLGSGAVVVGRMSDGQSNLGMDGLITRVAADGAQVWQRRWKSQGGTTLGDTILYDATVVADRVLVAGHSVALGALIASYDHNGKQRWFSALGKDLEIHAVAADPGGGLVAAGHTLKGPMQGVLYGLTALGEQRWSRTLSGKTDHIVRDLAVLSDGLATFGFRKQADGKVESWVVRTDPWGASTCALSGACAGKKPGDCDDKNPCTADVCLQGKCSHLNTTAPCDDGSACSVQGVCSGGACKKGADKLWQWGAASAKGRPETRGTAATLAYEPDSGALFAAMQAKQSGGTFHDVGLVRLNPDGTEAFYKTLGVTGGPQVGEMFAAGGSLVLCAGRSASDGGDGALIRVSAEGQVLMDKGYDPGGQDALYGCSASANGGVWAVGLANAKGNASSDGWILRVDAAGAEKTSQTVKPGAFVDLWAVAPLGTGAVAAGRALQTTGSGLFDGLITRVDQGGQVAWQRRWSTLNGAALGDTTLVDAMVTGDRVLVVGTSVKAGSVLAAYDHDGLQRWATSPGKDVELHAVALDPDGGLLASGHTVQQPRKGVLRGLTALGQPRWSEVLGGATDRIFRDVAALDDGLAAFGFRRQADGETESWVVRADRWGATSCGASGACAGKKASDCDDKNPCTADLCQGGKCAHANVGAACDDGAPCTTGDACTGGKCAPGKPTLWAKAYGKAARDLFTAVGAGPEGDLLLGGILEVTATEAWLLRVNTVGEVVWQTVVPNPSGVVDTDVAAVGRHPSKPWVGFAVGHSRPSGKYRGWHLRFDTGTGKPLTTAGKTFTAPAGDQGGFRAVAPLAGDLVAHVGWINTGGSTRRGWLHVWDPASDKQGANKALGPVGGKSQLHAAVVTLGGKRIVAAGYRATAQTANDPQGWVVAANPAGNVSFERTLEGFAWINDVVVDPQGELVVAGHVGSSVDPLGNQGVIAKLDGDGVPLWLRTWGAVGDEVPHAVALGVGGQLLVAGYRMDPAKNQRGMLARFSTSGQLLGTHSYGAERVQLAGIRALPDGGALMAGFSEKKDAKQDGYALRVDASGNVACAGACQPAALSKPVTCSDDDACTLDSCDPKAGKCAHTPAPDGVACDDGKVCTVGTSCKSGQCQGGSSALGELTIGGAKTDSINAGIALPGGGYVVVGDNDNGGSGSRISRLRADGSVAWYRQHPGANVNGGLTLQSVTRVAPGVLVAAGTAKSAGGDHEGGLQWRDDEGNLLVERRFSSGGKQLALAAAAPFVLPSSSWRAVVVGGRSHAGGRTAWFALADATDPDGISLTKEWGKETNDDYFGGVTMSGGAYYAVGHTATYTNAPGKVSGWFAKISATGQLVFNAGFGPKSKSSTFRGVAPNARGFVVVGKQGDGFDTVAWAMQTDKDGKLLWSKTYTSAKGGGQLMGVLPLGDGALVGGLTDRSKSGASAWAGRINWSGDLTWQHTGTAMAGHFSKSVVPAVGGFAVLSQRLVKGDWQLHLLRLDRYGNDVCHETCAKGGCSDGNACTADACDPAKSGACGVKTEPDGSWCSLDMTCSDAVCTAEGSGSGGTSSEPVCTLDTASLDACQLGL